MSDQMKRREFLMKSSGLAVAATIPPFSSRHQNYTQLGSPTQRKVTLWRELIKHLELQIPRWMSESVVPGLSIAVIKDARIAWRRGFGFKDSVSKAPVSNDTMFEACSASKPVFAYVVMKLCEKGVINLDTPLTKYVSERVVEGDPRLDLITARHILSHTGGFPNWRSPQAPMRIQFGPGEKFAYSGEGYSYLQSVVTHLTGRMNAQECGTFEEGVKACASDFGDYMRANLLVPFEMSSSGYLWNETFAKRMARPHDEKGRPGDNKKSTPLTVGRYGSAGALLTTSSDYAKFVIEVIRPKPSDEFRLRQESIKEMLRPVVKIEGGKLPASWSLGWQIIHTQKRDLIYHGGDNSGFHCCALASVDGKCGFVAMTNGENGPAILSNLIMADLMQEFLTS